MKKFSTESKRSPLTSANGRQPKFRYRVQNILLSERAAWEYPGEQAFIEDELERLTADGAEIVSIIADHEDLLVVLKAPAGGVA